MKCRELYLSLKGIFRCKFGAVLSIICGYEWLFDCGFLVGGEDRRLQCIIMQSFLRLLKLDKLEVRKLDLSVSRRVIPWIKFTPEYPFKLKLSARQENQNKKLKGALRICGSVKNCRVADNSLSFITSSDQSCFAGQLTLPKKQVPLTNSHLQISRGTYFQVWVSGRKGDSLERSPSLPRLSGWSDGPEGENSRR